MNLRRPAGGERGSVTLPTVYGIALSLLLFVVLANLAVLQYGRGVIRSALDEAARAAARTGADVDVAHAACREVVRTAGAALLGDLGRHVSFDCTIDATAVTARATGHLEGWLPLVPDLSIGETATAIREVPA